MNNPTRVHNAFLGMLLLFASVDAHEDPSLTPSVHQKDAENLNILPQLNSVSAKPFEKAKWNDIYTKASDSVVQVCSYDININIFEPYKAPEQSTGMGSAFFVEVKKEEGFLLTNFHVVERAIAAYIQIPSLGRERFEVKVVRARPFRDLALLKLTPQAIQDIKQKRGGKLPTPLVLGDSDNVKKLERVLTVGFPLTEEGSKYTIGNVSGRERIDGRYYMQITAPINWGSSGGPSFNVQGEVIGMNAAGVPFAQNTAFMIPSNDIKNIIRSAEAPKSSVIEKRPCWGIHPLPTHGEMYEYLRSRCKKGIYIRKVDPGSLFDKNGLKAGDILYRLNGFDLDRHGYAAVPWCQDKVQFIDLLDRLELGDKVEACVDRNGTSHVLNFTVEAYHVSAIRKVYPNYEKLDYETLGGMVLMELTMNHVKAILQDYIESLRRGYMPQQNSALMRFLSYENRLKPCVFVSNVFLNSQTHKKYMLSGTIISKVNGKKVSTLNEFRQAVVDGAKESNLLVVEAEDHSLYVFNVDSILEQEDALSAAHHFPKSSLIDQLY